MGVPFKDLQPLSICNQVSTCLCTAPMPRETDPPRPIIPAPEPLIIFPGFGCEGKGRCMRKTPNKMQKAKGSISDNRFRVIDWFSVRMTGLFSFSAANIQAERAAEGEGMAVGGHGIPGGGRYGAGDSAAYGGPIYRYLQLWEGFFRRKPVYRTGFRGLPEGKASGFSQR